MRFLSILPQKRVKIAKNSEKIAVKTNQEQLRVKKYQARAKKERKNTTKLLHQCHFIKKWRAWVEIWV